MDAAETNGDSERPVLRTKAGTFAKGTRGGPGRNRYTFELRTAIREVATPDRVKALVMALMHDSVKNGNSAAAVAVLNRVLGSPKVEDVAEPLPFKLDVATAAGAARTARAVAKAVASGEISQARGDAVLAMIQTSRAIMDAEQLESRLAELERRAEIHQ